MVMLPTNTLEKFTTFGDLLRFLRRRVSLTQEDLAEAVGYNHTQISRLEQNQRLPDIPTIESRFVAALGLEDEPKVVARLLDLAAAVRREDAPTPGLCPYKGLNYFDENDADLYVGREALTARLVERVFALSLDGPRTAGRFLAIVGASGSGKSSLARAGLVPALRWNKASSGWTIQVLTPGAHPLESLALAWANEQKIDHPVPSLVEDLASSGYALPHFSAHKSGANGGAPFMLVVDQFEEAFALCRSEAERAAFIENLLAAAYEPDGTAFVILTLRADFYSHCADYGLLRQALAQNQEYIGAMSPDELRRAIEEPARRGRWEFEPGLVDLLLHDVGDEPGALPLLSHALFETWQRRRGRRMTLSGYTSSGGVRGAIAETAETVFSDQFTPEQQAIARRIFLRLTELSDETKMADTRRRATFRELILREEEAETTQAVIKALADARLITTHEDSAEVAHEALIREWPTLRGWLEENREGLRLHHRLAEAAQEWLEMDRSADLLYRGARLAQACEWEAVHGEEMNALEREFLAGSRAASDRQVQDFEAQRQRELDSAQKLAETEHARSVDQAQSARRLRARNWAINGVGGFAIVVALIAGLFFTQLNRNAVAAQAEGHQAGQTAQIAFSRELAVQAEINLNVDTERSVLLALQAYQAAPTNEALDALHEAVLASRVVMTLDGHGAPVNDLAFSPDGKRFASAGMDHLVKLWDARTGKALFTLAGHADSVVALSFSSDGEELASACRDGSVKVWDTSSGQELFTIHLGAENYTVAFAVDGAWLVTGSSDDRVRFWNARSGQELPALSSPDWSAGGWVVSAVYLSPDGTRLAVSLRKQTGQSGKVEIWDLSTRRRTLTLFEGTVYPVWSKQIAFSPDGARIAVAAASERNSTPVYDATTGRVLAQLNAGIKTIQYSPDGRQIYTANGDGKAQVWDAGTGRAMMSLLGHDHVVETAVGSPGCGINPPVNGCAARLVTGDAGGKIKLWDITPYGRGEGLAQVGAPASFKIPDPAAGNIQTSPDGRLLAVGRQGMVDVWDLSTRQIIKSLKVVSIPDHVVRLVAFSPDGKWLAAGITNNSITVWDLATGRLLLTVPGEGIFSSLAFSPDGRRIAIGNCESSISVWDSTGGEMKWKLTGHSDCVDGLAFSADNTRLASSSPDQTTRIWDMQTGQEILKLPEGGSFSHLAFSSDGSKLAAADAQGGVHVYLLHVEDLIALAKSRLTRSLSAEECQHYLHMEQCPANP